MVDYEKIEKIRRALMGRVMHNPGLVLDLASEAIMIQDRGGNKVEFLKSAEAVWNAATEARQEVEAAQ